jgi:hypothetical protein
LAKREAARRDTDMQAIEAELQRIQGLVNKYDYKTPTIITRRVQSKAFKKRQAQKYFTIEVVHHTDRPTAPLELRYSLDQAQLQRDTALDGVSLGCRTFLSCISKGFGGFCSQLLRLRTGKRFSAFRLHGFADIF